MLQSAEIFAICSSTVTFILLVSVHECCLCMYNHFLRIKGRNYPVLLLLTDFQPNKMILGFRQTSIYADNPRQCPFKVLWRFLLGKAYSVYGQTLLIYVPLRDHRLKIWAANVPELVLSTTH